MISHYCLPNGFRRISSIAAATLMMAGVFSLNDVGMAQTTGLIASGIIINQRPPVVPEANPAIVLLPFFLAGALLASRHLFRSKAAQEG